ncbi:N-acetyltransferase [Labrys miyagiensis]|uniref:N-acetyltransferase n=1 Tax=Labrys miyagiensis TaxID=346912 RepID=A0ABQ6CGC2_9HYPH|nr:GNAT family N-acetyltransferase [Labrys miyagiensis]GLS19376.1 N-acetyltransferase [Labrys miyagiensis]
MSETVVDNPAQNRFEMAVDDELAVVYYRQEGEALVLVHTEVPQALSGQGIGSRLAQGVFDLIRASGRKAIVRCPFLAKWASRHPDVDDLVVG